MISTALDFMFFCAGIGILLVSGTWVLKILASIGRSFQTTPRKSKPVIQVNDEPLDPMGKRLQEFRDAQFGLPMEPKPRNAGLATWPVVRQKSTKKK